MIKDLGTGSLYKIPLLLILLIIGCDKGDPIIPNEEELITTLRYVLTPDEGNEIILEFVDIDGDRGLQPSISTDVLQAQTSYSGRIILLNEQSIPPLDIDDEVAEEADEHQFFFSIPDDIGTIIYADMDNNGDPVGLLSTLNTMQAGSGIITITLRHEPIKDASGVREGLIMNAGGETDIEVRIEIQVE